MEMSDYSAESGAMQLLTADFVRQLIQIWMQIFEEATLRENLRRLADHARQFYTDLVTESKEKRSYVEQEINRLREEAQTLRRLLNVEVALPPEPETPVPLLVLQAQMDNSLINLREQLRERRAQICELLLQQESLCEELGTRPRALLDDPLPSAGELQEFSAYLAALRDERVERLNRLSTMRREIKELQHSLELSTETHLDQRLLHQRELKLSADVFEGLERLHKHYTQQQEDMSDQINSMRCKLQTLWKRLDEKPPEHLDPPPTTCNQRTYDIYYAEVQRCEHLRSANVKRFVQQIRGELTEWWERTLKSPQERERFSHFSSKCYTDDLLYLHEMELEDLKQHYEKNIKIFQLYANRKILWERMCALEAKASDPNRFNNRGGQLLKEERERRQIETRMPKIELEIGALVEEYEQRENKPFLVHGENILEQMAAEWAHRQEEKETKSSARKLAVSPVPALAHSRSGARTPKSTMKKTTSVSNLCKTPTSSSQKRKLNTAAEHHATPIDKRRLKHAHSSPSLFLKPGTNTNSFYRGGNASAVAAFALKSNAAVGHHNTPITKRSLKHSLSSPSVFLKPPSIVVTNVRERRFKSPRVVSTTIRRKPPGRNSCSNSKKRRSMTRKPSTSSSEDGCSDADDTYDSFEKSIESVPRSSILPTSLATAVDSPTDNLGVKRMPQIGAKQSDREVLPNPQLLTPSYKPKPMRTPLKRFGGGGGGGSQASNSGRSPGPSSGGGVSRKFTRR